MPELPEIERYRQLAEATILGRTIAAVAAPDAWYLKRGLTAPEAEAALTGRAFVTTRRRGKLLLLDLDDGTVLGLRFGMSGRLLVDGSPAVDRLLYGRPAADPRYERFRLEFPAGGSLVMSDPRRLGGVELDPDLSRLGVDALGVSVVELVDSRVSVRWTSDDLPGWWRHPAAPIAALAIGVALGYFFW